MPPFVHGSWVALCYVEGRYNPPSARAPALPAGDFLGIYLSKVDPGFGLFTFSSEGFCAFHRCGDADATIEFAMIDALIHYHVPLEQWRPYPIGDAEVAALESLDLRFAHEKATKGLAAVLYQARLAIRTDVPGPAPMFLISERSARALLDDEATSDAIYEALLGKERARRRREAERKLRDIRGRSSDKTS